MTDRMGRRKHFEYSAQAALHGVKLKPFPGIQDADLPEGEPETWLDDKKGDEILMKSFKEGWAGRGRS